MLHLPRPTGPGNDYRISLHGSESPTRSRPVTRSRLRPRRASAIMTLEVGGPDSHGAAGLRLGAGGRECRRGGPDTTSETIISGLRLIAVTVGRTRRLGSRRKANPDLHRMCRTDIQIKRRSFGNRTFETTTTL